MIDVRRVLDGQVWPRDVHEFGGDETDILVEQLDGVGPQESERVAREVLELWADPDRIIRCLAVLATYQVHQGITTSDIEAAIARCDELLDVPIIQRNALDGPALRDDALRRLAEARLRADKVRLPNS